MHAITIENGALVWRERPDPTPAAGEVLLRVRAAGVNRADLQQRAGRYDPPPGTTDVLGLEAAGEVLEAPEGSPWSPGDRVHTLLPGGGYADRVTVSERLLMPTPDTLDDVQAAALPEVHFTAFLNLFIEAGLMPGERVLIHGGASGVGTAAIQQAREVGARIATTSSAAKRATCQALGAERSYDRRDPAWPARLRDAWEEVDVILDMVGHDTFDADLQLLATGGRVVWIATLSGSKVPLDLRTLMRKRLTLKGSTLRNRPFAEKITIRDAFHATFGDAIASGRIQPILHEVTDVRDAEYAHSLLAANGTTGKVILRVP